MTGEELNRLAEAGKVINSIGIRVEAQHRPELELAPTTEQWEQIARLVRWAQLVGLKHIDQIDLPEDRTLHAHPHTHPGTGVTHAHLHEHSTRFPPLAEPHVHQDLGYLHETSI